MSYENFMTQEQAILAQRLQEGRQMKNPVSYGLEQSAQPIAPMNGAMSELQASLDVLSKVAEELRIRLAPVLRSCGPENECKDGGQIRDASSPLREQLGASTMRVSSLRNVLRDILDRLEV